MSEWSGKSADGLVLRILYQSVVVKRDLTIRAKVSVYWLIYIRTLNYGQDLWIETKRMRLQIDAFSNDGWPFP